jgi:hypothetical protein
MMQEMSSSERKIQSRQKQKAQNKRKSSLKTNAISHSHNSSFSSGEELKLLDTKLSSLNLVRQQIPKDGACFV